MNEGVVKKVADCIRPYLEEHKFAEYKQQMDGIILKTPYVINRPRK